MVANDYQSKLPYLLSKLLQAIQMELYCIFEWCYNVLDYAS